MNVEALRAAALAKLSAHADPRARAALEQGEIVVSPSGDTWTTEHGEVLGLRVGLGVDPATLAELVDAHAVRDEMVAAIAPAVAALESASLVDLVVFWSRARGEASSAYRGSVAPVDVTGAVVRFLEARGEHGAARAAKGVRVGVQGEVAKVTPAVEREHTRNVTRAVEVLLAGPTGTRVRVV
jgi:hypothetical protein